MKASDMFKQTPIAPSNLKPVIPEGTDLNALTDQITKDKVKLDAENAAGAKKFGEEILASRIQEQRLKDAEANAKKRVDDEKKAWHDDVARRNAEKDAQKKNARQKELKAKLSNFIAGCVEVASDLEEIEDKNCVQVRLLRESVNALIESFPKQ